MFLLFCLHFNLYFTCANYIINNNNNHDALQRVQTRPTLPFVEHTVQILCKFLCSFVKVDKKILITFATVTYTALKFIVYDYTIGLLTQSHP
jgi:hypothetical protein